LGCILKGGSIILDARENVKGLISDIQKFSLHDGPGIRTLIFMKGCPIKCLWCSNPETQRHHEEITFLQNHCMGCGDCVSICPVAAIDPGTFEINRDRCDNCGKCGDVCPANAKNRVGRWVTVDELIKKVESDRIFYRNSGGGVTVSGGEPSFQYGFVSRFLKACQEININTAIETCGYAKWEHVEAIVRFSDLVFFDIKHMDAGIHRELTGKSNTLILQNIVNTTAIAPVTIRIPVIPGYNDSKENITETVNFVRRLKNITKIELLPYHSLGAVKYEGLGRIYPLGRDAIAGAGHLSGLKQMIDGFDCPIEIVESWYATD
jgi:pyruvate formate lyase activating enzyme